MSPVARRHVFFHVLTPAQPFFLSRAAQVRQNEKKKAKRAVVTELKKIGDLDGLIQAARTERYTRRHETALARGMDPNFCFWDVLAMNIQLLAASATDASLNVSQSLVDFVCKSAATKAMADLMIDYKRVNKTIMQFSKYGDYDLDAPPFMSCAVRFHNRTKTKSKTIGFLSGFACDDNDTIMYLQHIAEELDILRKRVYAWYKNEYGSECGVVARYTADESIGYPASDIVKKMVNESLSDDVLKDLFINLLNKTSPGLSSKDRDFFSRPS